MRKPAKPNSREISAEKLADLKLNAAGILAEVRRAVLDRYPFVGGIAMQLNLVPTRDINCPTAATDGNNLYFDIDFLSTLTNDERIFVLAHEVYHCAMMHFLRQECRDRKQFNIATDMEVNNLLRCDGMVPPAFVILPEKYGFEPNLSAEEYYEKLLTKQQANSNSSNSQSGDGDSSTSDGQPDDSGNKDGNLDGQFDKHIYNGDKMPEDTATEADDKWGKVGHDPDFMPKVDETSIERIREAAISSAQQMERQRGELPAHLKRFVNELLTPEIPWTELLCQFITRCMGDKANWNRPNRRFISSRTYLPSHQGEMLKVAVGIDTSGSTGPYIKRFLSELNGLVRSYGNYELHLIECDAAVGKYEFHDESDPLDLETSEYHLSGGGGTRLSPIFDYIRENDLDIDATVILSDGECEAFTEDMEPEYPVLWVITNKTMDKNFKFGEVVHFNSL